MKGFHPHARVARAWLIAAALIALGGAVSLAQQAPPAPPAPAAVGAAPNDAAPVPGGEATVSVEETPKTSFLQLLLKGGWFMVPIGATSLLGLAIILERLVALRRGAIIPPRFMDGLKGVFRDAEHDRPAALNYCHNSRAPIARVMAVGIRKLPQGEEAVEQGIEDAGANEVAKLRRNLRILYGVSAVAPMLGLLGTVWGMIEAFQVASAKGLGQAERLASGIYAALVTTLAGLTVAIPVLIFYYYFTDKIERIVSEMNDVSEEFVEHTMSAGGLGETAGTTAQRPPRAEAPAPPAPQPAAATS